MNGKVKWRLYIYILSCRLLNSRDFVRITKVNIDMDLVPVFKIACQRIQSGSPVGTNNRFISRSGPVGSNAPQ